MKLVYVGQLDEAQTDRLFSTKVMFSIDDWEKHFGTRGAVGSNI